MLAPAAESILGAKETQARVECRAETLVLSVLQCSRFAIMSLIAPFFITFDVRKST